MPEDTVQTPSEETSDLVTGGKPSASDDLQQQDLAAQDEAAPTTEDALPEDVKATLQGLRSIKGRLGYELGQARQETERERQERVRLEQEIAYYRSQQQQQQPPQQEVDPYQQLDSEWYQDRLAILTQDIEDRALTRLALRGEDYSTPEMQAIATAEAQAKAQQMAIREYNNRVRERTFQQEQERKRQEIEEQRRDMRVTPDTYAAYVSGHLQINQIPLAPQEMGQALLEANMPLSKFERMAPQEQAWIVKTVGWAAYGRKAHQLASQAPSAVASQVQRVAVPVRPSAEQPPAGIGPRNDASHAVLDQSVEAKKAELRPRFSDDVPDESIARMATAIIAGRK